LNQSNGSWDNFAKKNFSVYEFFGLKRAIGFVGIAITKNGWRFWIVWYSITLFKYFKESNW
jgi:hypothetical protein